MTKKEFQTNSLYYYANKYRQRLTTEEELESIDMTKILEDEEEIMIKNGEIIKETINAKMRLGKSTVAMARANRIYKLLRKYGKQPKNAKFGIKNIARDQQEQVKLMKNPNLYNDVIVIDEGNALEETGENSTAEQALRRVFSDVQAERYVHNIYCSPKEVMDENTDIILNIIATNHKTMTTRAKLYYRYYEGGTLNIQLLGYVDTYVGDIIQNWTKHVKEILLKPNKTKKEEQTIKEWEKKDWYIKYMIRKYEKMDLITKHGIFRPRTLEYAPQIKKVVNTLKIMAKVNYGINHDLVNNHIKIEFRNAKIVQSIIGEEKATQEAMGYLTPYKTFYKLVKDRNNLLKKEKNEEIVTQIHEIEEMIKLTGESIKVQEAELDKYEQIHLKYNEILEPEET